MIIALFLNALKAPAKNAALGIRDFLQGRGVTVVVDDAETESLSCPPLSSVNDRKVDFMISLGGDGTILRQIHRHPELTAPLVGVNLGGLGFMADIPLDDIYTSLQDLLDGKFTISKRIMMEGCTHDGEKCFAVNDIVIHRAQNPCLVDLCIYVDDCYLNTFSADGVIIATPNGSTAYSLAAGGPILTPEIKAFIITPISPHTISHRPIVLMPEREIRIEYVSEHDPVEITYDGFPRYTMQTGQAYRIGISPRDFLLVNLPYRNYFDTLRNKLGWTGKLKARKD